MQLPAQVVSDPLAQKNFEALQALIFAPGDLKPTMAATAPAGWVLADGATYNSVDYPDLARAMGATGATFTVPDLRGRVPVGAGTGAGLTARALAATGGTEPSNMPSHNHGGGVHSHATNMAQGIGTGGFDGNWIDMAGPSGGGAGSAYGGVNNSGAIITTQGGGADNMPPFLVVNWMIRT
jgi:microcystin-dependent protein